MKTPEKIYIDDFGSELSHDWHTEHSYENDIEYIRKDVFIEKMREFLGERYLIKSKEPLRWVSIIKVIDDFKKYMKVE